MDRGRRSCSAESADRTPPAASRHAPVVAGADPDEPWRLFVGLDCPPSLAATIGAWARGQAAGRAWARPVPDAALHLTLAFLGDRAAGEVDRIAEAAFAGLAAIGPPRLAIAGDPAVLPSPRRPRLVAVPVDGPGLPGLAETVVAGLVRAGLYEREPRPFWGHVTALRLRRGAPRGAVFEAPVPLSEAAFAVRLAVYRSVLRPTGSRYVPVAAHELSGGSPTRGED